MRYVSFLALLLLGACATPAAGPWGADPGSEPDPLTECEGGREERVLVGSVVGSDVLPHCQEPCVDVVVDGSLLLVAEPIGLDCLIEAGGLEVGVTPQSGDRQAQGPIRSLAGLERLAKVGGNLRVHDNPELHDLRGLTWLKTVGSLEIYSNGLRSLDGLDALEEVEDFLWINELDLASIAALAGIERLEGYFDVYGGDLDSVVGLENLVEVGGSFVLGGGAITSLEPLAGLRIVDYDVISFTLSGVDAPDLEPLAGLLSGHVDTLSLSDGEIASLHGLEGLASVGYLNLSYLPSLTSLDGLGALAAADMLIIEAADGLTSLEGLESLASVTGDLWIGTPQDGNASLTSLSGMEGLRSIGGSLRLNRNPLLPNLGGLEALESIGGDLSIGGNASLRSLDGLEGVREVGLDLIIGRVVWWPGDGGGYGIGNAALTDLEALYGLESVGEEVDVSYNTALTDAAAWALVAEIGSIGGNVTVLDNE